MPLDFTKPRAEPTLGRKDRRLRPERDLFPRTEIIYGLRKVGGYWTTPDPKQAHQIKRYAEEIALKEREQGNPIHQPNIYHKDETFRVFDSTNEATVTLTSATTDNTANWTYGNIPPERTGELRFYIQNQMEFAVELFSGYWLNGHRSTSMYSYELVVSRQGRPDIAHRQQISDSELHNQVDPLVMVDYAIDQAKAALGREEGRHSPFSYRDAKFYWTIEE